jgi:hypothetical protein
MNYEATLERYLLKRIDNYVRYLLADRPEEIESFSDLLERGLYTGEVSEIELAYDMKVPRKALYRFGYTDKMIDNEMKNYFSNESYPK